MKQSRSYYRPLSQSEPIDLEALIQRILKAQDKSNVPDRIKYRITRKIELARQHRYMMATCEDTGVNVLLDIPAIPGHFFTYSNPLAIVANARGVAQQSFHYLKNLDVQILAGVLITLADDYSLFRYAPSFSGTQKNAVLRSCNKLEIINAIQTIEHFVNSANVTYLPQLSFLLDSTHTQNSFEQKLQQWTKLLVEAIQKPDLEGYDENSIDTPMPRMREIISRESKAQRKEQQAAKATASLFKADMKMGQSITKELRKHDVISVKQKDILMDILDTNAFGQQNPESIKSIASKLELIESVDFKEQLATLAKILVRNVETQGTNEFLLDDEDSESSGAPIGEAPILSPSILPTASIEATEATDTLVDSEGNELTVEADELLIEVNNQFFIVPKAEYEALSPMGRIKYKAALLKQYGAENA